MRVVILKTGTNNCQPIYEPLRLLGHELHVITYDEMAEGHADLPAMVDAAKPDWVLLIGALEGHHGKPVPPVDVLARIGAKHLLVHLCCDGAEPLWWPQLIRYYDEGNFALQVNIDGVRTGPIGERGLTMLCPIDPEQFEFRPWSKRPIMFGFAGNTHRGPREKIIWDLVRDAGLVYRPRDEEGYQLFREFMLSTRVALNHPMTGGTTSRHVKARLLEAALAGCLVLEQEGSPAEEWFEPGVDYLAWRDAADIQAHLKWASNEAQNAEAMAIGFRRKVAERHSPAVFWQHVLQRLGLSKPAQNIPKLFQPPYRWWSIEGGERPGIGPPQLLGSAAFHNFVSFAGRIHVIPQALGQVDLARVDLAKMPAIKSFETLAQAKLLVGG